jgi:hypothetical protein
MNARLRTTASFTAVAVLLIAGSAFIHPFGEVRRQDASRPLLADDANIDPVTKALLERSCQNCHSEKTAWPWYSYSPPVSWLIERDVSTARAHLNLSRWNEYSETQRETLLAAIGAAVRNHQMPPRRFTLLHPEAVLSPREEQQIYRWAHAERRRLRVPGQRTSLFTLKK